MSTGVCGGRGGVDERDRPRGRPRRLLRDRRRQHRGCPGAGVARKRPGRVAAAFFGDGATNQGYFHECLNFAAVAALPVGLRVREQPLRRVHADGAVTAGVDIAPARRRYEMPAEKRGRQRFEAVRAAAPEAVDHARAGDGPAFLECLTYRHRATRRPTRRVPAEGRARALASRATRCPARASACSPTACPRRRSRASSGRITEQIDPRGRGGEGRAVPRPRATSARRSSRHERHERRGRAPRVRHAIRDALAEELEARGERVVFFGEDVAAPGRRVRRHRRPVRALRPGTASSTPRSPEWPSRAPRYGAAVAGLRPVFEVMFGDFMALPMDSLVNQAAKFWYISNEQGHGAARRPLGRRRGRALRGDPLADPRDLVPGRARPEDRPSRPRPPRPRGCSRRRSATRTPSCSSSTSACTRVKQGSRRRVTTS